MAQIKVAAATKWDESEKKDTPVGDGAALVNLFGDSLPTK